MACLHGKAASYNLLEGIYANAVAQEVERLCVESCNGCQASHPSQRQHDSGCDNSIFLAVPDWYSDNFCRVPELVQT